MKHMLALTLGVAALCACANAQPTPRVSDTCALLQLGANATSESMTLTESERTTLRGITTTLLPPPRYQCGDVSYQTDPSQTGTTYTAVGFSSDRRYARLLLQQVAGPLAGAGYACLYQAQDENWMLRGCEMNWIS